MIYFVITQCACTSKTGKGSSVIHTDAVCPPPEVVDLKTDYPKAFWRDNFGSIVEACEYSMKHNWKPSLCPICFPDHV